MVLVLELMPLMVPMLELMPLMVLVLGMALVLELMPMPLMVLVLELVDDMGNGAERLFNYYDNMSRHDKQPCKYQFKQLVR